MIRFTIFDLKFAHTLVRRLCSLWGNDGALSQSLPVLVQPFDLHISVGTCDFHGRLEIHFLHLDFLRQRGRTGAGIDDPRSDFRRSIPTHPNLRLATEIRLRDDFWAGRRATDPFLFVGAVDVAPVHRAQLRGIDYVPIFVEFPQVRGDGEVDQCVAGGKSLVAPRLLRGDVDFWIREPPFQADGEVREADGQL